MTTEVTSDKSQVTSCSKCNSLFPVNPPNHTGATGYATLPNGERICYPCADFLKREELKDRSKPFMAYVGKDNEITSWTGGKLMTITSSRRCTLTRQSFTHDRKGYRSIHAVDVHGGHWAGRGSEGIIIKLRPVNS